jgi:ABC-type molybdenum transport system ATPase subunit/photorepair protein PhrA
MLLDEVANGLDVRNHARFLHWLNGTARSSVPWVFATHRSSDVPESMTHLLELEQGVVKRSGALTLARWRFE